MPLVSFTSDEWYPVYYTQDPLAGDFASLNIDVPQETLDRWKKAADDFSAIQDEMEAMSKDAHKRFNEALASDITARSQQAAM